MRNPDQWNTQKQYVKKKLFSPRLQKELSTIPAPDTFPDIDIENGEGLFLYGPVKAGKTVLAAQYVLDLYRQWWLSHDKKQNWKIYFIRAPDIFREIKTTFKDFSDKKMLQETEDKIIERYETADLLVIDDLGMHGNISNWFLEILYMIIDYRWEHLKPTIITSNKSLSELAEQFGDDRITSRIERMCVISKKKPYQT